MFKTRSIWPALLALVACACDDAQLDTGAGQQAPDDARVGADTAVTPPTDAGPQDLAPPTPDQRPPDPDAFDPPPDMAEVPLDQDVPPVDMDVVQPERLVAAVVLSETPQADLASAAVSVSEPIEIGGAPGCVVQNVNPDANDPVAPSFDGGAITVSGLADGQPLVFGLSGAAYQPDRAVPANLFADGAALVAEGSGGGAMGAFRIEFPAPNSVSLQSPANLATVDRGRDLNVRWNAGNGDTVLITVLPTDGPLSTEPERGNWIFCGADDTGSFTVPASALGQFPDGGFLGQSALIVVTRFTVRTTAVGPHEAVGTASTSAGAVISVD